MPDKVRETLTLWRAFVPQWAFAPLSGDGAARFGGRWNPVGAATIYAARELSTAWAEYNQGFVQHPALIAQLELKDAALADLTDPTVLSGLAVPMIFISASGGCFSMTARCRRRIICASD
jgi:RES domain-containing protein